jgi:hypothetical protein
MLSQAEIGSFVTDGFVAVRGAVPADVLRACQAEIWSVLGERGVLPDDESTWREPVVRIPCPDSEAFAAAGTQPVLWEAFDQLIGEGRWWHRRGVGGTVPVRFPDADSAPTRVRPGVALHDQFPLAHPLSPVELAMTHRRRTGSSMKPCG